MAVGAALASAVAVGAVVAVGAAVAACVAVAVGAAVAVGVAVAVGAVVDVGAAVTSAVLVGFTGPTLGSGVGVEPAAVGRPLGAGVSAAMVERPLGAGRDRRAGRMSSWTDCVAERCPERTVTVSDAGMSLAGLYPMMRRAVKWPCTSAWPLTITL